jgi:hypothetical protein
MVCQYSKVDRGYLTFGSRYGERVVEKSETVI